MLKHQHKFEYSSRKDVFHIKTDHLFKFEDNIQEESDDLTSNVNKIDTHLSNSFTFVLLYSIFRIIF